MVTTVLEGYVLYVAIRSILLDIRQLSSSICSRFTTQEIETFSFGAMTSLTEPLSFLLCVQAIADHVTHVQYFHFHDSCTILLRLRLA